MVGSEGTEAFEEQSGGGCRWGGHLDQITQG